jgi:hypothetical protein
LAIIIVLTRKKATTVTPASTDIARTKRVDMMRIVE